MSRCFPYLPSGFSGDLSKDEALIVSIKLQEQKEKSIPVRVTEKIKSSDKKKDRKKEKKEKKNDKKVKVEKEKFQSVVESEKLKQKADELCKLESVGVESKGSIEVLERSNLTEEHGRPIDSLNVSCSSDSTGNSGKRKRCSSPASSIQGNGNILRIRLSSQKRDDPSIKPQPLPRLEPSISRTDVIMKVQEPLLVQEPLRAPSTSTRTLQLVSREDNSHTSYDKQIESQIPSEVPSTSGRTESRKPPSTKLSSHERKMLKKESLYNNLFQNLVPLSLHTELMAHQDDGEDWLFGKKDVERPSKKSRESNDLPCSTSAVCQPRAHFLSDVSIYALPFTVPF